MERLYVLDVFRVGDIPVSVTDIPNFTTFIANNNFLIYNILSDNWNKFLNLSIGEFDSKKPLFQIEYENEFYFDNFLSYISDIRAKKSEILYFIIFMLIQFFFNLSVVLTIRYFSPTHTLIVLVIGRTSPCIQKIINTKGDTRQIIFFLISLVIFFFLLVFNEVIELNCFKLQRNTIKNMQIRAINESIQEMDNKTNESSSWTSGNNNKSYDLGISSKNLNINENEEIEENDLINIRQNSFIYDSSMW